MAADIEAYDRALEEAEKEGGGGGNGAVEVDRGASAGDLIDGTPFSVIDGGQAS